MYRTLISAALLFAAALPALENEAEAAYQEASVCMHIGVAADTDDERYVAWPYTGTWRIDSVVFAPATAVAVHASNTQNFTVATNAGVASTTWTTLASHSTDSDDTTGAYLASGTLGATAYVIGTTIDLALTAAARTITHGYQIRFENTKGGTGPVWDGQFCVVAHKVG